jgi:hypothetical protein
VSFPMIEAAICGWIGFGYVALAAYLVVRALNSVSYVGESRSGCFVLAATARMAPPLRVLCPGHQLEIGPLNRRSRTPPQTRRRTVDQGGQGASSRQSRS